MGKTGGASWLNLMKKAFRSPVKENHLRRREEDDQDDDKEEEEEKKRRKRRWIFRKPTIHETTIHHNQEADAATTNTSSGPTKGNFATNLLPENNADLKQRRAIAVAMPTTVAAEAAYVTRAGAGAGEQAHAALDTIRFTRPDVLVKEQRAILTIQSAFRGYLARKALGALKGLVKLQALIRGHNVRKRAKMTLQCMQSLVRVQIQVCDQRRRLSCEGISCGSMLREPKGILDLQLCDKESTPCTADEGYDHSHALEKVEALLQKAKEAAKQRKNTLAHAFSPKMRTSNTDEDASSYEELDEDLRVFHRTDVNNCTTLSRASCDQPRDRIKNIGIDTASACSYSDSDREFWRLHHQYYKDQQQKFYSYAVPSPLSHRGNINSLPATPPFKMKNILVHSASPRCRRGVSRNSANSFPAADQPNYMAATASARARELSQSAPRQMPMTPEREKTSAAKKRLYFPVQ